MTLLEQLRKGDTLIVAALDRLGRKTTEILAVIADLQRRNVNLICDREGIDYGSPTGRLEPKSLCPWPKWSVTLPREPVQGLLPRGRRANE